MLWWKWLEEQCFRKGLYNKRIKFKKYKEEFTDESTIDYYE